MKKDNTVPYAIGAAFIILFIFLSFKPTSLQSVVGIDCPEFKTNANGIYDSDSVWVAVDCDGDGAYEAYGYDSTQFPSQDPVTGITLDGKNYFCFAPDKVWVYTGFREVAQFNINQGAASSADLTCGSTPEPDPEPTPGEVCVSDAEFPIIVNQWINQEEC